MDSDRIYRHFCMMARALEDVGERWSLLIVRDLLLGPQRFTDLARRLAQITPTRLTNRLRALEAAGVVVRDAPSSGREVWYRLTDAGRDLEPVVDALTLWGIEHAREAPRRGEPVHPEPVMIGTKVWLNAHGVPPANTAVWIWRFPGDDNYALRFDGERWQLSRGHVQDADLAVETTPDAWARFITAAPEDRRLDGDDTQLEGSRSAAKALARAFRTQLRRA